jgi:hypothetical protein
MKKPKGVPAYFPKNGERQFAKCQTPDGKIIMRRAYAYALGNFVQLSVRYLNAVYVLGNGDECVRGCPDVLQMRKV